MKKRLSDLWDEGLCYYGNYGASEAFEYLVKYQKDTEICVISVGGVENVFLISDYYRDRYDITVRCIVDNERAGTEYKGISIISEVDFDDYLQKCNSNIIVIIADEEYAINKDLKQSIDNKYKQKGCDYICGMGRSDKPFKKGWKPYFFLSRLNEFNTLYSILDDEISYDTMYEYLKVFVCGQRYAGKTFPEKNKYWGIDSDNYNLYKTGTQETFLNIGASCGDTIFNILKNFSSFRKIIAVEAEEKRAVRARELISMLDEEKKNKIQMDYMFLSKETTIDTVYSDEPISIVNMDIEGAELSVLETAVETIKKNRPVLAICVYHKNDDLISIPKFLINNCKDYVYALRMYPSIYQDYYDGIQQMSELVLYAIPKERSII